MTRIKICGITNEEDAQEAVRLGVDALGFVFAESPRRISIEVASRLIQELPPFVLTVGLFVDEEEVEVYEAMRRCKLDVLQFHGNESPQYCGEFRQNRKVIKAFRIKNNEGLEKLRDYNVDGYLLDAFVTGTPGGTGQTFDWNLAREATRLVKPIILSGGLNPDNVGEAIKRVKPYAVDVSSGVEAKPGKKDSGLMKKFVEAVRLADKSI